MSEELPGIPVVSEPELLSAISALVRSAESYRKAFLLLARNPEDRDRILSEHGEHLEMSEQVILRWCDHLGLVDE